MNMLREASLMAFFLFCGLGMNGPQWLTVLEGVAAGVALTQLVNAWVKWESER